MFKKQICLKQALALLINQYYLIKIQLLPCLSHEILTYYSPQRKRSHLGYLNRFTLFFSITGITV